MSEKLLPCPFCGGKVKLMAIAGEPYPPQYEVNLDEVNEQSDDICFVHCSACGANWHIECRIDSFPLDTIRAWNRRAQPANGPLTCDGCTHHNSDAPWPEICFECKRQSRQDMYHSKPEPEGKIEK